MLQPKKVKSRRVQKGKLKGNAQRGTNYRLVFLELKALKQHG